MEIHIYSKGQYVRKHKILEIIALCYVYEASLIVVKYTKPNKGIKKGWLSDMERGIVVDAQWVRMPVMSYVMEKVNCKVIDYII